jgi:NADPH:quinone reductase-like Zn-dependent oxidoreductase
VDVVIDPVGGTTTARSWPVLRSGGILVAIAEESKPDRGDVFSVYFVVRPDGTQLRELARLIDSGQLRPVVSAVFELGELSHAFLAKRGDRPPGKVVIRVGREDLR